MQKKTYIKPITQPVCYRGKEVMVDITIYSVSMQQHSMTQYEFNGDMSPTIGKELPGWGNKGGNW